MSSFILEVAQSKIALSCLLSVGIAQFSKGVIQTVKLGSFNLVRFLTMEGRMPSSHSAFVMALFLSIYRIEGISSNAMIAFVFAMVTLRDAMGVRLTTGRHAEILTKLVNMVCTSKDDPEIEVKEFAGHTLMEVIVGVIIAFSAVQIVFSF